MSYTRTALGYGSMIDLVGRAWHARTFSDFWAHVLVGEGAADVAIETVLNPWDVAAFKVVVEEAGGRVTDFSGEARIDGGSAVTTNGLVHDEVLAAIAGR